MWVASLCGSGRYVGRVIMWAGALSSVSAKNFVPLLLDFVTIGRIDGMNFGGLFAPRERPARIEDRARIGEIPYGAFFRRKPRVDRRAPAVGSNFDRGLRIAPRRYRPQHIVHVRRIDIVVDKHD